jgi:hypothetical protein
MKIGDYKQMMAYLTRPEQPKEQVADLVDDLTPGPLKDELTKDYDPSQESYEEYLQRKALGERPFNAQDGGRANLYAGGSLEKFASQIKDLHLKGISADKINEILKFEKDRSTTIDELIRSMIRGDAPITINAEELKRRPNLLGANKTGTPADRQEALKAYVDNFKKKNNRLPSKKELENAKFDFGTITKAVKSGNIEVLPSGQFLSMVKSEKGKQDILELSKDPEIRNIFKTGQFDTVNTINKVKEVLGDPNMSDNVAGTKIHTLAKYFSGEKSMKGINPTFRKNAELITEKFPYKEALRELGEIKIGESVGEQSLKTMKKNIRGGDFYSKARLSDLYNIDEVLGISSSVSKGTTPYGIFGQIIGREQNTKDKLIWDARKSKLEGALQEAIAKKSGVPEAVRNFNKEAKKYEEKLNAEKMRGAKKITLPRVSLASPNKTIANFKNFNNTYKEAFTDNFKQKGYSFIIPKDLKTIPELRDQVNDPKSDTYKQIINTLKKGFNESDEKKLFDKINKATPDALKKIIKTIPRIASVAGIVGLGLLASGQQAEAAGEETKTGSILPSDTYPSAPPSVLNKKEETNLNLPPEAALAGAATYKYGPQLLKILKLIGKGGFNFLGGAFRTFGSPLVSSLYGASEILDYDPKNKYGIINPRNYKVQEDPDVRMAGLSLLLPDIAQKVRGPAATSAATGIKGFLSKAGRIALNPYFKGARLFTPVGLGIAGAGQVYDFYKQYQDLQKLKEEDPEAYKKFRRSRVDDEITAQEISTIEDMGREGAMYGGRVNYAGGGMDMGNASNQAQSAAMGNSTSSGGNNSGVDRSKVSAQQKLNHQAAVREAQNYNASTPPKTSAYEKIKALGTVPLNLIGGIFGNPFDPTKPHQVINTKAQMDYLNYLANQKNEDTGTLSYGDYGTQFNLSDLKDPIAFSTAMTMGGTGYKKSDTGDITYTGGTYDFDGAVPFVDQGGLMGWAYRGGEYLANKFNPARLANGGRIGFADGPKDPGKRKTMKILAGLASLPIVGRFFDVAQVAEKAAPAVVETFKNAPAHFIGLVNKIRALGRIIDPKKLLRYDKEKISNVYDYGDYRMYEKLDGGVEIQKEKWMGTNYGDAKVSEEYMSYNPKTPKFNKKGEKIPDEYEEVYEEYTAYPDSEGKMKDIYESVEPNTIDEGTYSKEELEQLIVEQIEDSIKKGKK